VREQARGTEREGEGGKKRKGEQLSHIHPYTHTLSLSLSHTQIHTSNRGLGALGLFGVLW